MSRQDVYDYLKCPKIVAFRTHMSLHERPSVSRRAGGLRHETGVIGEITTRHMLAENVSEHEPPSLEGGMSGGHDVQEDHAQRTTLMKRDLERYRIALDETIGGIFKETVKGLEAIKRQINDQYGEINVIGRGESRNGLLSSTSRPDFVAVVGDRKKLVMVEVKNAKMAGAKPDKFQATFYNTVGAKFGITVMEEYRELSSLKIAPMTTRQKISETILVYPRRGEFEVIKDRVDIGRKTAQGIWAAKQLGMEGKAPETDCDSSCPHHRLKRRLPEGNIDVAITYVDYKNAADIALTIHAVEIFYSMKEIDGFCIVTSDNDFAGLVKWLRDKKAFVAVIWSSRPDNHKPSFEDECDVFKYVDDLPLPGADSLHALSDWKDAVKESIRMVAREDGWALLSDVGNKLKGTKPALKFRDYCHRDLLPLIESCKEEFETGPERVRLRPPV